MVAKILKQQLKHSLNEFLSWLADRLGSPLLRSKIQRIRLGINADGIYFGRRVDIRYPLSFQSGPYNLFNDDFTVVGGGGCKMGSCIYTGPKVTIVTVGHDIGSMLPTKSPVIVESFAWIGAGATILPGVVIGRGAVIGAGSVVTKSVAPFQIVGGNPASFLKERQIQFPYRAPGGNKFISSESEIN